ncbi:MAG TPA: trypsin-like peptidase domain-containing protein [Casimicrobiaceae bacterium]|nr:trypsin-like peptidase domain-containing protein [Casimicrobiaceae bacterium]
MSLISKAALVATTILVSTLAVAASTAAPVSSNGDAKRVTSVPPAEFRPLDVAPKVAPALVAPNATPYRIALAEATPLERAALKRKNAPRLVGRAAPGKSSPLVIGFPRAIPAADKTIQLSGLAWQTLADGSRAARIDVRSPGAAGLRISLAMPAAHPDLSLRLVGNGPRAEVHGAYAANAIAAAAARDGYFWSPVLEGDKATVELHAVNGATVEGLALSFGPISHLVVAGASLNDFQKRVQDIGDAGSCNIDVACVTPESTALNNAANSVGKLVYNDRFGSTFLCTGTLLNDSTMTFTPYLLSASHCFDDAFTASTINVYWFFRAQTCGSLATPAYVLQTGGAFLLARSEDYDWSLMRLNRTPPAGVFFSAWRAEPVPHLAVATSLHHPEGDLEKFSQGSATGYEVFSDGSSFIKMQWTQGTTEQGSSGAALFTFLSSGGYYEVRGGLFGGDALCTNRAGVDYYSRLDNMLPLTRQYLTPEAKSANNEAVAVEFYNRALDHYFITIDSNEINFLDTGQLRGWERTGIRFLAYNAPAAGANPVCRFYLKPSVGDSHFYSADPAECERVKVQFGASWIFESPSVFYIALPNATTGACPGNTRPVWRFFNSRTTNHRYTQEVGIRESLRADPVWVAEGYGPDAVIMCAPATRDF